MASNSEKVSLPLWPTTKLLKNLKIASEAKASKIRFAVLLSTGALNPIHYGHVSDLAAYVDIFF